MAKRESNEAASKLCFVVGPIGNDDSEDRIHADWLLEEIILPVFSEHFSAYRVERADKISSPGRIDTQIITALLTADLVIADLTTLNPNAFYEIGIRHAIQKPVIHMHLDGQPIPFDISSFRSIMFSRKRPRDVRAARESLLEFAQTVTEEGYEVDNPVTFSRGKVEFEKTATPAEKITQDQLAEISTRLANLERSRTESGLRSIYADRIVRDEECVNISERMGRKRKLYDFELDPAYISVYLVAKGSTSANQLKVFMEDFLPNYITSYVLVAESEDKIIVRVKNTPSTLAAILKLKRDLPKFPHNIEVIPFMLDADKQ